MTRRIAYCAGGRSIVLPFAACLLLLAGRWNAAVASGNDASGPGANANGAAETRMKAADFKVKDLKGESVTLSHLLKDGPVFLHFWTTWCPSCQREMSRLDGLHRKYRDRGFRVLAIAQDDPKTVQKVKPLVESKKYEMVVIADSKKEIGNRYNVRQYPTSFLIAKDGGIVHYAQGYLAGDEEKLEDLVRGLLESGVEAGQDDSGTGK